MTLYHAHDSRDETDEQLVGQFLHSSDMALLGTLYMRYADMLYGVCLKYLKQPESAKDAALDIFEQLGPKLRKYPVENFRAWLYTLARNHCLMQLRKKTNLKTIELQPDFMQSQEELHLNGVMEKEQSLLKMEHCLQKLPPEQKQAVEQFYLEGKCYKEIADATGMEWNSVRSHIQNGRRNLKLCMDKMQTDNGLLIRTKSDAGK